MSAEMHNATTARPATGTPARLHELLVKTSRTFALNIPLLAEPTRCEVTVAYLLFRVADTLEDSTAWTRRRKLKELARFAELLREPTEFTAARLATDWTSDPPLGHEGYLELLAELPRVMRVHRELAPRSRQAIAKHTLRTVDGMSSFIARGAGDELRLRDLADLKDYCYAVAGIVGEMLTELFIEQSEQLRPAAAELRELAPAFGEALQLVNILKDSCGDRGEGRHFLPEGGDVAAVFRQARRDMGLAARYIAALDNAGAARGVLAFTALPLLLARATLDCLERRGPGSKIRREDVARIVVDLKRALDRGELSALFARF
ncbi:MAG TPA: squalene/phytoene synthase family protein [Candidatus Polarisedimenticolaceae bacterium]|nr:squalene/phytoene synthase family protein [Candidatus Polarisedimenticolaceae bacterium]